ncbi:MAG: PKD domain-containing protein, partial [Saprospiraceae bacterium]
MNLRDHIFIICILLYACVYVTGQVNANFTFDKSEGCGSLAVNFIDQSTSSEGSIVDWRWDLGGVTSTKQHPGIIFTKSGSYTICLTIKTSGGLASTICKDKVIHVYESPVADFSTDIKEGCIPITATFKDQSKSPNGKIVSWIWDVGGSANLIVTSDSLLPIKTTFGTEGNYTSTLSVTDAKGCKSIITKPNLIKISSPPKVNIDFKIISNCRLPWEIQFINLDPDPFAIYEWNFGNGQNYIGTHPPITLYQEASQYHISVMIQKGPCRDTILFSNFINTNLITDFSLESKGLCEGQKINITDISTYEADSLLWDFGDGTFSTAKNPEHTYTSSGCYSVKLIKYIRGCVHEISRPCINILPQPKVESQVSNAYSCIIPASVQMGGTADTPGTYQWHINGVGLDTTLAGANSNLIITKYGRYNASLIYTSNSGCIVNKSLDPFDINKFEVTIPQTVFQGCVPYEATWTANADHDTSIVSWKWEIGSPVIFSSDQQSPTFMIKDTGIWDLRLEVVNKYGCKDTIVLPNFIKGGKPPIVDFVASPLSGCISDSRKFTSLISGFSDQWKWVLNDTTVFSMHRHPDYTFPDFGVFDISLTAFHHGCGRTISKDNYITVFKPKSAFEVKYHCDDPKTISIQNQTRGADSVYWVVHLSDTVRDTIRDSLLNTYTFPDRGLYFLTHYASSVESGCVHIITDSIFIVDLKASYTLDTIRGCAPLQINTSLVIQDAVSTVFLPGEFTILMDGFNNAVATYQNNGIFTGPQLVVKDRHGCQDTFQSQTPVIVSKINGAIGGPEVICAPNQEQYIDLSDYGTAGFASRKWILSPGNVSDTSRSPTFDFTNTGDYVLTLEMQDNWGCKTTISKDIKAVPLHALFTSDTLSCVARAIRFKVDSDVTFVQAYHWDFGDGTTSEEKNPLHQYKTEGVYDVCTELVDSRGCSKKICKPKFVQIIDPIADFTGDPLSSPCPPLLSAFTNKSKNATTFIWDFGDNSGLSYINNPSHVYTDPGSFTLRLIAQMMPGCADTLIKKDFVHVLGPNASLKFDLDGNCTPLNVKLSATSDKPYSYIWDYGDGNITALSGLHMTNDATYTYVTTGSYIPKLLVSDTNGCTRIFAIDPIKVNELSADFSSAVTVQCDTLAKYQIINSTKSSADDVHFQWLLTGDKVYESNETNPTFNVHQYGFLHATLIASTVNCRDTIHRDSMVEIASSPKSNFKTVSQNLCQNNIIQLQNTSTNDYGKITAWNWDFGNGKTSDKQDPETIFEKPGNYLISLKCTTDKGCFDSITIPISFLPNTLITLPQDLTICLGDSLDIEAYVISTQQDYTFGWKADQIITCNTRKKINIKPSSSSTYYFTTKTTNGCLNTDSISVTVIPIQGPQLELSKDTIICLNGNAMINILNFDSDYTYIWDQKDFGLGCYKDCKSIIASPKDHTTYHVQVLNKFGCLKEDSITIDVEKSIPDFLISNRVICEDTSTILSISGGNHPVWSSSQSIDCTTCAQPKISPIIPGYYFVEVSSDIGCRYRDSIFVDILPKSSISAGEGGTICKGESFMLQGKGQGIIEWSSDFDIENKNMLNPLIKPQKTSYIFLKTVMDQCILYDSLQIIVLNKTTIDAIGDTICPGENTVLIATGDALRYSWFDDGANIGSKDTIALWPEETTIYRVIGSRGLCMSDTVDVMVLVRPD